MTRIPTFTCLLAVAACSFQYAEAQSPLSKDRTGLRWVLPFTKARQHARDQKRLLMIKPVAFGTSRDGGW